jgi:polysaccharide biosynthesis protein PelG
MAIFLVRMETDFVEYYDAFYNAVRTGGSLELIEEHRNSMVETIRLGIFEIVKIQAIASLAVFALGERILSWMGISTLYLPLLYIDVIAARLQVVLLGVLNVFFYLDKRRIVLALTGSFVLLNVVLTKLSIVLGPAFYGYGFALALLAVVLAGFVMLGRTMERLEYQTFMMQ